MKTVILAGGLGTRLSRGDGGDARSRWSRSAGSPILWHIMKHLRHYGFNEFLVALGYKGEIDQALLPQLPLPARATSRSTRGTGTIDVHDGRPRGLDGPSRGHRRRHAYRRPHEAAAADARRRDVHDDLRRRRRGRRPRARCSRFHRSHGKLATVTAVRPPARFGGLAFDGDRVATSPRSRRSAKAGSTAASSSSSRRSRLHRRRRDVWEREPLERLAADGQLVAYRHEGFWQCMDTLRDVSFSRELWESGAAPWKVWS